MKRTRTRTKPKTENPLSSNTRNIGIQTADFDSFAEIAKLQEQIKQLQLQNDVLKQRTKTPNKSGTTTNRQLYTPETSKSNIEKHSCTCKGNCLSRVCGCVKKNNKCDFSCKCNAKICQNQKSEYDKENINKNDTETLEKQSTKREVKEITKNPKSLFSPNVSETYKDYDEYIEDNRKTDEQINDICFNFNNTRDIVENLKADKTSKITNNITTRKKTKNKKPQQVAMIENDTIDNAEIIAVSSKNDENFSIIDPMKPKHQLPRTPPNKNFTNKSLELNITEPQYESNKDKIITSYTQVLDLKEEEVDWQQHTAQLIPCKKCKRTFMPHRIQKHESCCKRI